MPDSDTEHLDLDRLEALRAGAPTSARDTAHLAWCPTCQTELDALRQFAADLAGIEPAPAAIPPDVDRRMRALAAAHAKRVRRDTPWRAASLAGWAAAAAAVLAVATVLLREPGRDEVARAARPAAVPEALDIDGDGRVTVLDAFAEARRRDTPNGRVEEIMTAAVSLRGRR